MSRDGQQCSTVRLRSTVREVCRENIFGIAAQRVARVQTSYCRGVFQAYTLVHGILTAYRVMSYGDPAISTSGISSLGFFALSDRYGSRNTRRFEPGAAECLTSKWGLTLKRVFTADYTPDFERLS